MTKKIVVPVKALLFPLYHAKPVKNFSVGSGEMLYSKCLRPHDMDTVYSVLHLLGRKEFTKIDLVMLSVLSGQKKQNVSTSIRRSWESEICFNNCFDNIPVLKMRYFDVSKERKGNQRVFVFSQNRGYLKLFSFGYCELDLDIFLSLSTLEKRCYEYFLYRKWRANNNPKKWDSAINFDKISKWIGLRDSNRYRRLEKTQKLLEKMKDIGVIKKGKKQDIAIVEFSETEEITGEIPRFKKKKDPALQKNTHKGRDTNLNESAGITQTPQEVKPNKQAAFAKSAQQPTHEHFKQPVKNCDTSQDSLMEIQALVNKMREEFKDRSIDFDPSLIWDMVLENIITETQVKERFDIFFRAWTVIKGREAYKIKSEFGNFGGAIRTFFKDGKDWFSKYVPKRQETTTDKRDSAAAQKKEAEKQNKRAEFFKVWDNANEAVRYNAYKRAEKNNPMSKGKPKFLASAVAHEFAKGVFSDDEVSVNFLCDEDFAIITGDIQDYMKPVSW